MTDITLDPHLHTRINRFCEIGDTLAAQGEYPQAIEAYQYAWNLLPEPKTRWEAATWILAAVGDAWFLHGDYTCARDKFQAALPCPGGSDNAFIHLRLGQALFELGDTTATTALQQAHNLGGEAVFADEDPKYLAALH